MLFTSPPPVPGTQVTEAHFDDLESRYGAPVVVLNLLKSKERRPREVLLRRELAAAIAQLNAQRPRGRQHIVYMYVQPGQWEVRRQEEGLVWIGQRHEAGSG